MLLLVHAGASTGASAGGNARGAGVLGVRVLPRVPDRAHPRTRRVSGDAFARASRGRQEAVQRMRDDGTVATKLFGTPRTGKRGVSARASRCRERCLISVTFAARDALSRRRALTSLARIAPRTRERSLTLRVERLHVALGLPVPVLRVEGAGSRVSLGFERRDVSSVRIFFPPPPG